MTPKITTHGGGKRGIPGCHCTPCRDRIESLEADLATWRQRAEEAEECIVWVKCDDPEHERLAALATENQAMRKGLERIAYLTLGDMEPVGVDLSDLDPAERASAAMERIARDALASAPPVADEREG